MLILAINAVLSIAMQAVVGSMKFEEEGLLLELLIAVCLLSTGDFELQRLFRKSGRFSSVFIAQANNGASIQQEASPAWLVS